MQVSKHMPVFVLLWCLAMMLAALAACLKSQVICLSRVLCLLSPVLCLLSCIKSYVFLCSFVVYGGDALISHCIWSAGYGMTQPVQSYFKPHVQMFDLGRWERRPMMDMIIDATEGDCNELCQAQVGVCVSQV